MGSPVVRRGRTAPSLERGKGKGEGDKKRENGPHSYRPLNVPSIIRSLGGRKELLSLALD